MKKIVHPMKESLNGKMYYNLDWPKYFDGNGSTLGTPEERAQKLSTEPPEAVSTFYKLDRVREFNNIEITRGGFGGVGNFANVLYLKDHPEKSFSEALDPAVDPDLKHECGVRAVNILAGLPEDMPENASKEDIDKYMKDGKPVACEGYADKMKDLIIKSHEVFAALDFGKEISYFCDAKDKSMSEILSDQDNVIHIFQYFSMVQTYMQQLNQTITKACKAAYPVVKNWFWEKTTDETTKQIYREALDEMQSSGLYDRYNRVRPFNPLMYQISEDVSKFLAGYNKAKESNFTRTDDFHSWTDEMSGGYTYLYQTGQLDPEKSKDANAIDIINKGNVSLAKKYAISIKLWGLATSSKVSEIPKEVYSNEDGAFQGKMGSYLNDLRPGIDGGYKSISPVELADMAMNHGQMASHYMFKGSKEVLNDSFTSEQIEEINALVAGDKNLEPLATPDVLAAFAITHTLINKNLSAESVFTEEGLQQIDGKATLDFLNNNPVMVTITEGGEEVTTFNDAAIRNIVNEGDGAYNSLKSYMFTVSADAKIRESQYYGLSELARFTENCGAAYSEIEKIKDKDGNRLYSCKLANTDDPVISNAHYISSLAASAIDCEDPYKALAGKIFMDEMYPALDGKSMAQISELYPKDFFKNYAADTEAYLKANIPNLTRQEAMAYIEGKEVEKIKPQVINNATKGDFKEYQNNVIEVIVNRLTDRAFHKCNDNDTEFSMAYHDKLDVYLRQVLQANLYAQKCNNAEDQEKIRQAAKAFLKGGYKLGTCLPDFITNDMLRQASDLALTDLAAQGNVKSELQPGDFSSPYADREKEFVIGGEFTKQLANFNPKNLTIESLYAGMGFYDSMYGSMLENMPELTESLKIIESLKDPEVADNEKSERDRYFGSTDLFLIDGMSADDYLRDKMGGQQYGKYRNAEKECLKKAMIAKAVSGGEHVVEIKQYLIDPARKECAVVFTALCNKDNPKFRKALEKYNAKKAEKVHADMNKRDPVIVNKDSVIEKYNEMKNAQTAPSPAPAVENPQPAPEPECAPEVQEPAPEMQEEREVEYSQPAPEPERTPEVQEPAPEMQEEREIEDARPEPAPEANEPTPEVEKNKTVEDPAPENTANRHKDKELSDMIARQLNHGSGQLSKDVTNDEPAQKLTKDVPVGK